MRREHKTQEHVKERMKKTVKRSISRNGRKKKIKVLC